MSEADTYYQDFMNGLVRRNPHQSEFHQAVAEVASSVIPYIVDKPIYRDMRILDRMTEPDRIVVFRVCWEDDDGRIRVNRGYRVQANNAIGPYKGGLRFHPSVSLSVLKFLAFEQIFKNSLTGLPIGGGKGGSDFNPKGRSDLEIMRFCQSFMSELYQHIGADIDVPAGDIGVGAREIGYLFGQYKRLTREFKGVLTGKGLAYGGSQVRTEATGYGAVYFMANMLEHHGQGMEGKTCAVSGSGNVASYAVEKINQLGGKAVTMSDSGGFLHVPDGIDADRLASIMAFKSAGRGRLRDYAENEGLAFYAEKRPWVVPCDLAFPCATQNELNADEARELLQNGCHGISEGANMPCTHDAIALFQQANILFGPAKAANAGGVALSGLEMSQNSARLAWSADELQTQLQQIMHGIHSRCVEYGESSGGVDYQKGANIAGFIKVADAMLAYGVV
jgi:glutamate dehydrogenase (NADP+)